MQTSSIIQQFIKNSGRLDLVKQDRTTDNGALFYINAGQTLLDLLQDNIQTKAWHYDGLVTGDSFVEVPKFRSVEELYVVSDTLRIPLTRKSAKWIRQNYTGVSNSPIVCITSANLTNKEWVAAGDVTQPSAASRLVFEIRDYTSSLTAGTITIVGEDANENVQTEEISCTNGAGLYKSSIVWSSITSITTAAFATLGGAGDELLYAYYPGQSETGTPLYYAPTQINVGPGMIRQSTRNYMGQRDFHNLHLSGGKFKDSEEYRGLLIAPAIDQAYTLEGLFRFYTPDLVNSTDKTYWTEFMGGAVLIQAALLILETFHRNTEGFKDGLNSLQLILGGIDNDLAEDEDDGGGQINSSWAM